MYVGGSSRNPLAYSVVVCVSCHVPCSYLFHAYVLSPIHLLQTLASSSPSYLDVSLSDHDLVQFTMPPFEGRVTISLQFYFNQAPQTPVNAFMAVVQAADPPVITALYSAVLSDDPCLVLWEYPRLQPVIKSEYVRVGLGMG